ncbi:hypothetical protein [Desulfotomaculum copahuensis]|uniref:Uncharacterized protein n=1 Tax=Desulfotomaculum copahuensis TaxID=1838280 RepID=A0A1B7LBC3_9FIRM|nr:hypothetical protein [Desulfotomaculum copahuensis]OAT79826.1 hypothetical protein A6M21_15420 [Desulfotomaculum copahuensis]
MKMSTDRLVYIWSGVARRLVFHRSGRRILSLAAAFLALAAALAPALPAAAAVETDYRDDSTVSHPYAVQQLDDGNLLICRAGFLDPGVTEVTPSGAAVWSFPGVEAASAQRLSGGDTLIADSGAPGPPYTPRVIEVTPAGRVAWEYRLSSPAQAPRYAQRLANGDTLITLPFEIIEVSPAQKVVWSYGWGRPVAPGTPGFLANPVQAVRLANGNTLIVDQGFTGGRVFEITPQKQVVWQAGDYLYSPAGGGTGVSGTGGAAGTSPAPSGNNGPAGVPAADHGQDTRSAAANNGNDGITAGSAVGRGAAVNGDGSGNAGNGLKETAGNGAGDAAGAAAANPPGGFLRPIQLKRPTGAVRLANGDTLIADAGTSTLWEVTADGQVVRSASWQDALAGLPVMNQWLATPLSSGWVILPVTMTSSRSRVLVVMP